MSLNNCLVMKFLASDLTVRLREQSWRRGRSLYECWDRLGRRWWRTFTVHYIIFTKLKQNYYKCRRRPVLRGCHVCCSTRTHIFEAPQFVRDETIVCKQLVKSSRNAIAETRALAQRKLHQGQNEIWDFNPDFQINRDLDPNVCQNVVYSFSCRHESRRRIL